MTRLKERRVKMGIKKEQLAIAADCAVTYIEKLENGKKTNPTLRVMQAIATLLECEISDLWPAGKDAQHTA